MKYLDLLMKLKEAGQTAEKCKRELKNIAESGKTELHRTANLKAAYLQPTYNGTAFRTVFEGSYAGASSFSSWDDGTGNNRRMLEIRNRSYESSRDNALLLRDVVDGSYYAFRVFHAGMATPVPVANGGTGASTAKAALNNLGIFYSATLPSSGTDGQICLVPV